MNWKLVIGWAMQIAGTVLWFYGYFFSASAPIIDWPAFAPTWISGWLPNWQTELGMFTATVGALPLYWPDRK